MVALNRYSEMVLNYKLTKLAELCIKKNKNPFAALVEAAMDINIPIAAVLSEFDTNKWSARSGQQSAAYQQSLNDKWQKYMQTQQQQQQPKADSHARPSNGLPQDVNGLTNTLKQVVQSLSIDHKISQDQISKLVTQATQGLNTQSINTEIPQKVASVDGTEGQDKGNAEDLAKRFGTQSVNADNSSVDPHNPAPAPSAATAVPAVKNPDWYGQMTNAERAWFDKLSPQQKQQFITQHDQMVGSGNGISNAGDAYIAPGSKDHEEVGKIAAGVAQRNPAYTDSDATWKAASGLWNRHKLRQQFQKNSADWGEDPVPDFDDLLHKDHTKNMGNILEEWCQLAGIKNEKKKGR